jgi:tRNA threonylcarbamoyladenosine biosynthesis protein TsaE
MSHLTLESRSPEETRSLGERLSPLLQPGDAVLLSGELGAGKTMFVQGIARGLGFDGPVSSKSFVLLGEYEGRLKLYHADLYRLEDPEQVQDLALDEVSADGILVVEWPERAQQALPEDALHIRFQITGESTRSLHPEAKGERARELLDAFTREAAERKG